MGKVKIIAEIGNTHEGSLGLAKQFARVAVECGVDAVKFQMHIFDAESLADAPNPVYFSDESRKEYFDRTAFTLDQWKELKNYVEELGAEFICSPFSLEAVDQLEILDVNTHKIPSGEVSNIPLLEKIGRLQKNVLLSSGMSTWTEIALAVETLQESGASNVIFLQCTSEYPCPPERSGLNVLKEFQEKYPTLEFGYSDHTLGNAVALAAVVMGSVVIEKHFTLSKDMYGSDAKNSCVPKELTSLVHEIRDLELALTHTVNKDDVSKKIKNMKDTFEKSLVSVENYHIGDIVKRSDLAFKKPGWGIPTRDIDKVVGKRVIREIHKDTMIQRDDLAE